MKFTIYFIITKGKILLKSTQNNPIIKAEYSQLGFYEK